MDESVRVRWTNEAIKCFLESCIEEINKVGRNGGSLRKASWINVAAKIEQMCHIKLTQKQLKNHYDYLKGKYAGWVYLRNRTGNIYDPELNMFKLSPQEWEDFFKGHPKAKTLRTSPLLFPDLCIALFEGTSATGSRAYAPSSTRERISVVSSSSFTSHIHSVQNEEDEDDDEEEVPTPTSNVNKTSTNPSNVEIPSQPSSRPNKKSKTKVDMDELALEMRGALLTLLTRETPVVAPPPPPPPPPPPQPQPHYIACFERLNTLGLDPRDPLYIAAVDIFGHNTLYRETWMMIPPDPDVLKDWIVRTARRLGYMQ